MTDLAIVLRRRLEQRHVVAVSKLLRHGRADGELLDRVTLIPDEYARDRLREIVLIALADPLVEIVERRSFGYVVHEDDRVHVAVVVLHHALAKALLPRRVPQLQLNNLYEGQGFLLTYVIIYIINI